MKINSETRLLLIMGAIVLLGGGGMALLNRAPGSAPPTPPPTPIQLQWTPQTYAALLGKARHVRGDAKKARFTIIEFGDLQCPSCRNAYNKLLVKLEKTYPLQFAFLDLPLPMHEQAIPAALATEAADRQGKFWPMFDELYTGTDKTLSPYTYTEAAKKLGLDAAKFDADSKDPKLSALIIGDAQLGTKDKITQTPTFFLRDEKTGQVYEEVGGILLDKEIAQLTQTQPIMPESNK